MAAMGWVLLLLLSLQSLTFTQGTLDFIREATVDDIHAAFKQNRLSSRKLVEYYLTQIRTENPRLRAVIEVNPVALSQADKADSERHANGGVSTGLQGIPILLKDNIATADRMNTTAGSLALVGSVVARDAGVVARLRRGGAVILGKASLSEWAHFRSSSAPSGWCARSGQGKNPYVLSADPCGSSSGSAIAVAANLAAVSLGTETDGSILCPSSHNSIVGIKPTVGLTSRSGVIPISPRQDTVGPMCRTVADAVHVLDVIVGFDPRDARATMRTRKFIPEGGYKQFLKLNGLKGKRIGILRNFFGYPGGSIKNTTFNKHFATLEQKGATLVDNLEISDKGGRYENVALLIEFRIAMNQYLSELVRSPVRSLADLIKFNNQHSAQEKIKEYGQDYFLVAEQTEGLGAVERTVVRKMRQLSEKGIERLMKKRRLDAVLAPEESATRILAIGGYPGINVPAGFDEGVPFGICFGGLKGSEPKLIEIAYAFEQATRVRKPPAFKP